MKCPPEKAAGYTVVTAIIAVVLSWIMAMLIAATTGLAGLGSAATAGFGDSSSDNVTFDKDSRLGRLAALGERMQAASEASAEAEAARKRANPDDSGARGDNPQANAEAMGAMMGAMFGDKDGKVVERSEEHTSELQSLMRNSYAVFCLKKKKNKQIAQDSTRD